MVPAASPITPKAPRGDDKETVGAPASEYADLWLEQGHTDDALGGFSIGGSIAGEMTESLPALKTIVLVDVEVPGADHSSIMISPPWTGWLR